LRNAPAAALKAIGQIEKDPGLPANVLRQARPPVGWDPARDVQFAVRIIDHSGECTN